MKIEEILSLKDSYKKALNEHGKSALQIIFNEFFVKHPEVEVISWTQYTPGFNDGDPCVFSMGELGVKLLNDEGNIDEDNEEEDGYYSSYNFCVMNKALGCSMDALEKILNHVEDLCEEVFSSDVRVVVYRDRIETEEYDCGY